MCCNVLGIPTQIIGIQGNENLFQSRPLGKVGINSQNLWVKSVGNYSYCENLYVRKYVVISAHDPESSSSTSESADEHNVRNRARPPNNK